MSKKQQGPEPKGEGPGMAQAIAAMLDCAGLGEALRHEALTIYPLTTPNGHELAYDLLEDALKEEKASISEVGEGGSVPELMIENRGEKPILILEGDVLIGAKQNRVVNLTMLVAAHATATLPVSCVERGRWHSVSAHFSIKRSAHTDLRRAKVRSVLRSKKGGGRVHSDQMEVWDKVDECLSSIHAASPTASLEDGYVAAESQVGAYREKMTLPEGATGFLVAVGNRVIGMDLFDSARTAKRCWGRLSESYFMESLRSQGEGQPADPGQAKAFLKQVGKHIRLCEKATGLGQEIEVESPLVTGIGLAYQGHLVHLAAFALDKLA